MRQERRPRTFDDVLCPGAFERNLIGQAAPFGQDEQIDRIAKMLVVHDGVVRGIRAPESYFPARLAPKQRRHHGESLLVGPGLFPVRFRAVALRVPDLDVGLLRGETHGVAAFVVTAGGVLP